MKNSLHAGDFRATERLARKHIRAYLEARGALKNLGVIRSELGVQGDYAEWLVAGLLKLRLASNPVQKGHDATDAEGHKYQIKSRIVRGVEERTSFDMASPSKEFDYLLCVFFSEALEVLQILKVPYDVVKKLGSQPTSTFRFRWNRRTARHSGVERLPWGPKVPGSADCTLKL